MDLLEFYGLKEDPFKLTPDPLYFYPSGSHNEALLSLNYVIEQKEGFCLITGEPGTGKTTLLNVLLGRWRDNAEVALILTPRLSPEEFLISVIEDLNLKLKDKTKNYMLKAFRDFLIEKSLGERRVLIIVDEAQDLPDETLEELRLLSNLETEKEKLLQIILIGQPELEKRLRTDNLKQLNQRITIRARLSPLTITETPDYINYRLVKAGKGFLRLDEKSMKPIHNFSKGIPRIINLLSSRALMSAYLEGSNLVTLRHVRYAMSHLGDSTIDNRKRLYKIVYGFTAIILLTIVGVVVYNYLPIHRDQQSEVINQTQTQAQTPEPPVSNIGPSSTAPRTAPLTGSPVKQQPTPPSPILRYVVVKASAANIRAEPRIDADKIGLAYKGKRLARSGDYKSIDATGRKWHKLMVDKDRVGWIADSVVISKE